MTTARERLRVRQRVRATLAAVEARVLKLGTTGVVRGFGRSSNLLVSVQKTGTKYAQSYHHKFWEPA